jgi:hypothetical protein
MTCMGGEIRWRTMPWMVLALAVLILPFGGVSIYFIIIQPIVIGTWCTICLIAGLATALMIPCSLDEFVAIGQFLVEARRNGNPFWRTFWTGDAMEGGTADPTTGLGAPMGDMIGQAARDGVRVSWTVRGRGAVSGFAHVKKLARRRPGRQARVVCRPPAA